MLPKKMEGASYIFRTLFEHFLCCRNACVIFAFQADLAARLWHQESGVLPSVLTFCTKSVCLVCGRGAPAFVSSKFPILLDSRLVENAGP